MTRSIGHAEGLTFLDRRDWRERLRVWPHWCTVTVEWEPGQELRMHVENDLGAVGGRAT